MRETKIPVEQQSPQGVLVCDHAGLVINIFSKKKTVESGAGPIGFLPAELSVEGHLVGADPAEATLTPGP